MPDRLLYTRDHEYVRMVSETAAAVGIGAYAVEALGGVVSVTLPPVGLMVRAGDSIAAFESAKAACEVFAPASGTVTAINEPLLTRPALVNGDPLGAGWFFRLELADPAELARLFDADAYALYLDSLG
ncbi:glycine cleavage system protein H [Pseudochelatococcus sp. B33]